MTDETQDPAWLARPEYGTVLGVRFFVALSRLGGRTVARFVIRIVMLYYFVLATKGRRASRDWLTFIHHRPARFGEIYHHLCNFGLVTLDRVFLLQGRRDLFQLTGTGTENLDKLRDRRQGAILLGAHMGSFEAMRARSDARRLDLHILAYANNARKIASVLSTLDPNAARRVIELGSPGALLKARELVEGGGMLAVLGDRTGLNSKTTTAQFFDHPAPFPTGPFLLASALKCPVLLVFGIYRGGNRYDMYCEPFSNRIDLPRGPGRDAALQQYAQAYAARLEHFARRFPANWFNLYDFWSPENPAEERLDPDLTRSRESSVPSLESPPPHPDQDNARTLHRT